MEINNNELNKACEILKVANGNIKKCVKRALDRTISMAKTEEKKIIRQRYTIKAKDLNNIKVKKANLDNLEVDLLNSTSRFSLNKFNINKTPGHYQQKLQVEIIKGNRRKSKGFWSYYKNNTSKIGIYSRDKGTQRKDLKRLYGPSTYQMGVNQTNIKKLEESASKNFSKRLQHEINRELNLK